MRYAVQLSKAAVLRCHAFVGLGRTVGSGILVSNLPSKSLTSSTAQSCLRRDVEDIPSFSIKMARNSIGQVVARAHGVSAAEEDNPDPQLPLCLRQTLHSVPLQSLLEWKSEASHRAVLESASWKNMKDMPTMEDLETELAWLLDDCVVAVKFLPDGGWNSTSWRELERRLQSYDDGGIEVQLRESLEKLGILWQKRLRERVPLQYVTATAFWRDLILSVGPGVLIPRPETELMVDFALEAVKDNGDLVKDPWADLGTGSGALAIGLAKSVPEIPVVWAVDVSTIALEYVKFNAQLAGQEERVRTCQGSWFEPLYSTHAGKLAGIVSNPPYIPSEQMQDLQAEVGLHEPWNALEGGQGLGVDALVPICTGAMDMLRPAGILILETAGGEQAAYVAQLLLHFRLHQFDQDGSEMEMLAFDQVRIRKDLRGVDRFVTAIRRKG